MAAVAVGLVPGQAALANPKRLPVFGLNFHRLLGIMLNKSRHTSHSLYSLVNKRDTWYIPTILLGEI